MKNQKEELIPPLTPEELETFKILYAKVSKRAVFALQILAALSGNYNVTWKPIIEEEIRVKEEQRRERQRVQKEIAEAENREAERRTYLRLKEKFEGKADPQ